ncbi:putative GNAT family acetyltransferase [Peribacillus deserti]|uniref:GNAT family acetyltransferase n=1 Tax=Peribacillus deserti TaxID=673318 RepID=A0ABS2QK74_9BACI|nr:GNAT family N-acetyltransferase [Peribacillus deserti]MBM7693355.1 putative GNAT family acetyltransferase [Peribacillus deserti]
MEFKVYKNIYEFFEKTQSFYLSDELVHNLPYGTLKRLVNKELGNKDASPFMALIESGEEVILSLLQTPPHNLIISSKSTSDPEILRYAAELLIKEGITIPGVIGSKELAQSFADVWVELTGQSQQVEMNQRIYRLDQVLPTHKPEGRFAPAENSHAPLIMKWVKEFCEETGVLYEEDKLEKSVKDSIASKSTFLWLDSHGNPVSMAKEGRKIETGTVVTLVYTPHELRGKGYASACVGELSQELLKRNTFCCLYTDLGNRVSNGIYMKIGYEPVCDSIAIKFSGA